VVGPEALLAGVSRIVLQAALDAEMADHLGYEKGQRPAHAGGNHRNGTSAKIVLTEVGPIPLEVPRDRRGEFQPQIIPSTPAGSRGSTRPSCRSRPRAHNRGDPRTWPGSTESTVAAAGPYLVPAGPGDHPALAISLGAVTPFLAFRPEVRRSSTRPTRSSR
jgi:hypothetical protein